MLLTAHTIKHVTQSRGENGSFIIPKRRNLDFESPPMLKIKNQQR